MFGISVYKDLNSGIVPEFSSRQLANFDYIELNLSEGGFDDISDHDGTFIENRQALVVHLPELDFSNLNKHKRAIEMFSDAGINFFNIHLFSSKSKITLEKRINAVREFENLASTGLTITVENTEEGPREFRQLFSRTEHLRFCLDVGHANLGGNTHRIDEFVDAFSDRLSLVHIHDNLGGVGEKCDLHLPLGKGKIDFSRVFSLLKRTKYEGLITLELYKAEYSDWISSVAYARQLIGSA